VPVGLPTCRSRGLLAVTLQPTFAWIHSTWLQCMADCTPKLCDGLLSYAIWLPCGIVVQDILPSGLLHACKKEIVSVQRRLQLRVLLLQYQGCAAWDLLCGLGTAGCGRWNMCQVACFGVHVLAHGFQPALPARQLAAGQPLMCNCMNDHPEDATLCKSTGCCVCLGLSACAKARQPAHGLESHTMVLCGGGGVTPAECDAADGTVLPVE
jgi:hypothetical protein